MKKKILGWTLAMAVLSSSLVGCLGSGSSPRGQKKDTGDKVKLKALFIAHPLTQSVYDMQWLMDLEEAAGVSVEWEQIYTDWSTTKSTRFASGDIPDLLFNATTDADYTTYAGLFEELSGLIESEAPNIRDMFEEEPDTKVLAETIDGKIYGIPKFQGKWPETNTVMFINKTWLDHLGLETPTTFSELNEVLIAFKEQDANGNGNPNDEIPLDFQGWFSGPYSLTNLIGGLGIQLTNWGTDGYFVEDDIVKNYAIDERYKLLVKYLSHLYAQGLINENAITNDYSAFQSLSRGNEQGEALIGVTFGWEETDKFGPTLHSQYISLGALAYDIGTPATIYDTRWTHDYSGLNMSSNRVAMSAKSRNKEAAMRFIDAFYDATTSVEVLFGGIQDGRVEKLNENTFKVLNPLDPDTDSGTWKWTSTFADNGPMYIRRATEIQMTQDMTFALQEREVYKDVLAKISDSDYYPQMFMKYTAEDQNKLGMLQANINNITDNYWALWLTGESNIDKDWEEYIREVERAGLLEVLQIRQSAFDAYRN